MRETLGAVLVLGSAFFAALAQEFVRKMVKIESTAAIVFYFSVTATLLSLLTIPYGWVMPSGTVLVMLIAAGLLGGVGQIFLTSAYRFADVSVIAPFEYASMLLALGAGYFIFDEVPTLTMPSLMSSQTFCMPPSPFWSGPSQVSLPRTASLGPSAPSRRRWGDHRRRRRANAKRLQHRGRRKRGGSIMQVESPGTVTGQGWSVMMKAGNPGQYHMPSAWGVS